MKNHEQLTKAQAEQLALLKMVSERVPNNVQYDVCLSFYDCHIYRDGTTDTITPTLTVSIWDETDTMHVNTRAYLDRPDSDEQLAQLKAKVNAFLNKKYPLK